MLYKDAKRNTWYFRTYIEDKFGNKVQKCRSGFKTKSEAKEAELLFLTKLEKLNNDIFFQELYDDFIKDKKQNLKAQSIRSTISRYENHILPYFKDYKLSKITRGIYIDWKDQIINKKFSYKYNANLHGCMVAILNYAVGFYDLDKNIASKVGNFSKRDYMPKVNFWTYEQFNQFIKVVDDEVYSTLYKTLYFTGMRLGECLALSWNHIKDDYIKVERTLAKEKLNNEPIFNTPKTKSSKRNIRLDNETITLLNKLKVYYKAYVGFNDDWFVFGGLSPLSQTTVGRRKDDYCLEANVKRIKIHDFRHSHATLLLSRGVPITVISKRLGHADLSMTLNTYSHLIPEDEDKAVNLLNNLIEQENNKRTENLDTKKALLNRALLTEWSGRQDSNLRPLGPKPSALPS